jgi:hypothetical protein
MKLFDDRPRRARRATVDGKAKYAVLKAIALACAKHSVPPLDERLKSMVAAMIGNLLRGGWRADEIEKVAVELALKYDRFHAHESMLGLQRVMEIRDEERQETEHAQRMKAAAAPVDPRVAEILGPVARHDPRRLPGNHRPDGDPCKICQGPPGVHVAFGNIPELEREAMAQLARERDRRRPMRKVGE